MKNNQIELSADELIAIIDGAENLEEGVPYYLRELIRRTAESIEGVIELMEVAYNAEAISLIAIYSEIDGELRYIYASDGGSTDIWEPDNWADMMDDYAQDHEWGAREVEDIEPDAGIHEATGLPYAISEQQQCDADNEQARRDLWRQIRGLAG